MMIRGVPAGILAPAGAPAAFAFDVRVAAPQNTAAQAWTALPITYVSDANLVVVSISWEGGNLGAGAGVTVGGVAATLLLEAVEGANHAVVYYLTAGGGLPAGGTSRNIAVDLGSGNTSAGALRAWSFIGAKTTGTIIAASGGNVAGTTSHSLNRGCTAGSLLMAIGTLNRTTNQTDTTLNSGWNNINKANIGTGGHWHIHGDQGPIASTTTFNATVTNVGGATGSARMATIIAEVFAP